MKKKRSVWMVESRFKENKSWSSWVIGGCFYTRGDAINCGAPYKDKEYEIRIVRYDSSR